MEKIIESKRVSNNLNEHFFFVSLPAIYQAYYNDVMKKDMWSMPTITTTTVIIIIIKNLVIIRKVEMLKTSLIFFISVVLKLEKMSLVFKFFF